VTRYPEGFSHFVTSIAAPVASGWSVRRVGLTPTGKRRLSTAHTHSGQWDHRKIVKPTLEEGFDYKCVHWADLPAQ
jgi:hypothetical protein